MTKGVEQREGSPSLLVTSDIPPLSSRAVFRTFYEFHQAPAEQRRANKKRELAHFYSHNLPLLDHLLFHGRTLESKVPKTYVADAILGGGFIYYSARRRQIESTDTFPCIQPETIDMYSIFAPKPEYALGIDEKWDALREQGLSEEETLTALKKDPDFEIALAELGFRSATFQEQKTHEFINKEVGFIKKLKEVYGQFSENIYGNFVLGALEVNTIVQGHYEEEVSKIARAKRERQVG